MNRWTVVSALMLTALACGPLSPPRVDGGTGGGEMGGGSGGGTTGGGGGTTDAGSGGGGGGGGGGGATDAGTGGGGGSPDAGTRRFSSVILSTTTSPLGPVKGFAETGGAIWAITQRGQVLKSTAGGPFQEQLQLTVSGSPIYAQDFSATPDGTFFVLTTVKLLVCSANCDQPGSWSTYGISASDEVLASVCGNSSSDVIAIGARGSGNAGVAYAWNGSAFSKVSNDVGVDNPQGCWRQTNGELVFGGVDQVLHYGNSSFTPEPLSLADAGITQQRWRAGAAIGGAEFVVGPWKRIARRVSGGVELLSTGTNAGELRAVVAPSATEGWAFGGGPVAGASNAFRWDGARWSELVPELPLYLAHTAFVADGGIVYVGGEDDSAGPIILRGTLQ